jgi:ubiquinone/menaquinone biosynthesis C-methylase UbiE
MTTYLKQLDWHRVDASADPKAYAAYLDRLDAEPEMQYVRRTFIDELPCKAGEWILDSGCGTGSDAALLGQRVGLGGRVLGMDLSHSQVRCARSHTVGTIDYAAGSLLCLPLAADTFDGALCNRVLMHLADPQTAVDELVRALKPGAWRWRRPVAMAIFLARLRSPSASAARKASKCATQFIH